MDIDLRKTIEEHKEEIERLNAKVNEFKTRIEKEEEEEEEEEEARSVSPPKALLLVTTKLNSGSLFRA